VHLLKLTGTRAHSSGGDQTLWHDWCLPIKSETRSQRDLWRNDFCYVGRDQGV